MLIQCIYWTMTMSRTVLQKSTRNKCFGCKALKYKTTSYECDLGFAVTFQHLRCGKAIAPRPGMGVKCYKPRTFNALKSAKEFIENEKRASDTCKS